MLCHGHHHGDPKPARGETHSPAGRTWAAFCWLPSLISGMGRTSELSPSFSGPSLGLVPIQFICKTTVLSQLCTEKPWEHAYKSQFINNRCSNRNWIFIHRVCSIHYKETNFCATGNSLAAVKCYLHLIHSRYIQCIVYPCKSNHVRGTVKK